MLLKIKFLLPPFTDFETKTKISNTNEIFYVTEFKKNKSFFFSSILSTKEFIYAYDGETDFSGLQNSINAKEHSRVRC